MDNDTKIPKKADGEATVHCTINDRMKRYR